MKVKLSLSTARGLYVRTMFQVVGRAMQALSQFDEDARKELAPLETGFIMEMTVLPAGPGFVLQKQADGSMKYLGEVSPRKADLSIAFKHVAHAFLVFSFQESTPIAFAHDRMVADGDIGYALRITRVLNRLESFILPRLLASRAVKEYPPQLKLPAKLLSGARVYLKMVSNLVTESAS